MLSWDYFRDSRAEIHATDVQKIYNYFEIIRQWQIHMQLYKLSEEIHVQEFPLTVVDTYH